MEQNPLGFEKSFQLSFGIKVNDKQLQVKLGGKIDRIDKTGNAFRVIDYKTGKIERGFEAVEQLFEISGKKQNKEAMQILLYSFLLSEDKEYNNLPVVAGLYGLRDIFKGDFDYHLILGKNQLVEHFAQVRDVYLDGLKNTLMDIFDPQITFTKVVDKKACEYCDYRRICHR